MRHTRDAGAIAAAISLLLVGCSDDSDDESVDTTTPADAVVVEDEAVSEAERGDDATHAEVTETTVGTEEAEESAGLDDPAVLNEWEFFDGTERVALVSEWAEEHQLLTGGEVVEALGDPTGKLMDAQTSKTAEGLTFLHTGHAEGALMDTGAGYLLEREGESRTVNTYVSEFVAHGPGVGRAYANVEQRTSRIMEADERYDPASIGVAAFAYEMDGGSGARDRTVVVNTGDALVVVVANTMLTGPEADLSENENLSRDQVDDLVEAAVEKLG